MDSKDKLIRRGLADLPLVAGDAPKRIGYIVNYSFHIWYKVVMNLMEVRADQYGIEEFLIRDARQDLQTELSAMDELISEKVDVLVVTPVASPDIDAVAEKAADAGIPLVLEANPIRDMTTMVAICDYDAGVKAGKWAGYYARTHFQGRAKVLDIAYPSLQPCLLRSEGFLDGLQSVLPGAQLVERVNGEAMVDVSSRLSKEAFKKHHDINIVFGMDDESIHGGLNAVQEMGLDEEKLLLVGFGMAGDDDKNILLKGGCWKASVAMFPEWVGLRCIDQAVKVFNGLPVRTHDIAPTIVVSEETIIEFYTHVEQNWIPNFKAIAAIEREESCSRV